MIARSIQLRWRCIDPEENKARWYSLATDHDLWGKPTVVKRWGRLNGQTHEKIQWYNSSVQLKAIITSTKENRRRHGYHLLKT